MDKVATRIYFQAYALCLQALNASEVDDLILRCMLVYAFYLFVRSLPDSDDLLSELRAFLSDKHLTLGKRLLDTLGTHNGGLAVINGALFYCAVSDGIVRMDSPDVRALAAQRGCCLCQRDDCVVATVSPGVYARHAICVPVCSNCSSKLEQHVVLLRDGAPLRASCSACGRAGVELSSCGGDDQLCTNCQRLQFSLSVT